MTRNAETRSRSLVAVAALAGVVVASGLMFAATRLATDDGRVGSPAPTRPAASPRRASETSTGMGSPTVAPEEERDPPTEVTVDVPRSEQTSPPGLHPSPAPPPGSTPSTTDSRPITDPGEAARAYLVAAESVTGNDAGQRHHQARPYMAPGNPAATTGLLVTEPPPAGHSRTIEVLAIAEQARNDELGRIAYHVTYRRYLSPTIPATAVLADGARRTTFIVVERQAAGKWLVLSHTAHLDPAE
jgi:hypothetical protein